MPLTPFDPANKPVSEKLEQSEGPTITAEFLKKQREHEAFMIGGTEPSMFQYMGDYGLGDSKYDEGGMYPSDMHNLEEFRSQGQSWGAKLGNGVVKLVGKTATATLGGTIGAVTGMYNAIKGGEDAKFQITDLAEGDFQKGLDSFDAYLDEQLPNYYSAKEKEMNFGQSLGKANFWFNDVFGAISFTVGAVLSEAVWSAATAATFGGASAGLATNTVRLIARAANLMKKGATLGKSAAAVARGANKFVTGAGELSRIGRRLYTGSFYEAGVEYRHFAKEAEDNFKRSFVADNGRAPNQDELDAFAESMVTAGNGVIAANMGIVGLSHFVALPRIFGSGVNSQILKAGKLRAIGDKAVVAAKNLSKGENIGKYAYIATKNPFMEGIFEEGLQGVTNKSALEYTSRLYDKQGHLAVADFYESVGKGFADTYGSKEGWKEIGIGMLIGMAGSPNLKAFKKTVDEETGKVTYKRDHSQPIWTGGIAGEILEDKLDQIKHQKIADAINKADKGGLLEFIKNNPSVLKSTSALFEHGIRSVSMNNEFDAAARDGNVMQAKNLEHDFLHSFMSARIEGGFYKNMIEEFETLVSEMTDEEFINEFGYDLDMDKDELQKRRNETIEVFKKRAKRVKKSTERVDNLFFADTSQEKNAKLRQQLIYMDSTVQNRAERIDTLATELPSEVATSKDALSDAAKLKKKIRGNKAHVSRLTKEIKKLRKDRKALQDESNVEKLKDKERKLAIQERKVKSLLNQIGLKDKTIDTLSVLEEEAGVQEAIDSYVGETEIETQRVKDKFKDYQQLLMDKSEYQDAFGYLLTQEGKNRFEQVIARGIFSDVWSKSGEIHDKQNKEEQEFEDKKDLAEKIEEDLAEKDANQDEIDPATEWIKDNMPRRTIEELLKMRQESPEEFKKAIDAAKKSFEAFKTNPTTKNNKEAHKRISDAFERLAQRIKETDAEKEDKQTVIKRADDFFKVIVNEKDNAQDAYDKAKAGNFKGVKLQKRVPINKGQKSYSTPSGVHQQPSKYVIDIVYEGVTIGYLYDPRAYTDEKGQPLNPANHKDLEKLNYKVAKQDKNGKYLDVAKVEEFKRTYKEAVQMFKQFDEMKAGDTIEGDNLSDNFISTSFVSYRAPKAKEQTDKLDQDKFKIQFTYKKNAEDGTSIVVTEKGILIWDNTNEVFYFNGNKLNKSENRRIKKMIDDTVPGKSPSDNLTRSSKAISRFRAVLPFGDKYLISSLRTDKIEEVPNTEVDTLSLISAFIENVRSGINTGQDLKILNNKIFFTGVKGAYSFRLVAGESTQGKEVKTIGIIFQEGSTRISSFDFPIYGTPMENALKSKEALITYLNGEMEKAFINALAIKIKTTPGEALTDKEQELYNANEKAINEKIAFFKEKYPNMTFNDTAKARLKVFNGDLSYEIKDITPRKVDQATGAEIKTPTADKFSLDTIPQYTLFVKPKGTFKTSKENITPQGYNEQKEPSGVINEEVKPPTTKAKEGGIEESASSKGTQGENVKLSEQKTGQTETQQTAESENSAKDLSQKQDKIGTEIGTNSLEINLESLKSFSEEQLDALKDWIDNNLGTFTTKEQQLKAIKLSNKIEEEKIKREEENPNNNPVFLTKAANEEGIVELSLDDAVKRLSKILPIKTKEKNGIFTVEELKDILENASSKDITYGKFVDSIISLRRNTLKGAEYHEAFHAVFRTFLSDDAIARYYAYAKEKYGSPTAKQLISLQSKHENLTNDQLKELWYEEAMAEDFRKYMNKKETFFGKLVELFRKLLDLINVVWDSRDKMHNLFEDISGGKFLDSKPAYNVFRNRNSEPAFLTLEGHIIKADNTVVKTPISHLQSERIANMVVMDFKKTNTEDIPSIKEIKERINEIRERHYTSEVYEDELLNLLDKGDVAGYKRALSKINLINIALKNNKNIAKLADSIKERLDSFRFSYEEDPESVGEQTDNEEDINENNWSVSPQESGGYGKVSKQIKQFLAYTTEGIDEFGLGLTETELENEKYERPIDSRVMNDILQRVLADALDENQFIKKMEYLAKYNPSFRRVKQTLDNVVENEGGKSKSPLWKKFKAQYNKHTAVGITSLIDKKNHSQRVFQSNQNDVQHNQMKRWARKFLALTERGMLTREQYRRAIGDISEILADDGWIDAKNKNEIIDKNTEEIKVLFGSIGIDLSPGYIRWSILDKYRGIVETKRIDSEQWNEFYDELLTFPEAENIDREAQAQGDSTVLEVLLSLSVEENENNWNPFVRTGEIVDNQAITKFIDMAETNALFDETVYSSVYTNDEGKKIFDKVDPSELSTEMLRWRKTEVKKMIRFLKEGKVKEAREIFDEVWNIPVKYDADAYWEVIKDNPLLHTDEAELIFTSTFRMDYMGGTRETLLNDKDEEERWMDKKEGKAYKHFDPRTKTLVALSYFAQKGKIKKSKKRYTKGSKTKISEFSYFVPWVNEAKNTQPIIMLPTFNYTDKGSINAKGRNVMYQYLLQELKRIRRVQREINILESTDPNVNAADYGIPKVKNYNVGAKNGLKLFNFQKILSQTIENGIDEDFQNRLIDMARGVGEFEGNDITKDLEIDAEFAVEIKDRLGNTAEELFEDFLTAISSEGLITPEKEGGYKNELLPAQFEGEKGKVNEEALLDYFVNDYTNSMGVIQIFLGDLSDKVKDNSIDPTKRFPKLTASGPSLNNTISRGTIVADEELPLTDSMSDNLKDKTVGERSDGQSECGLNFYVEEYLDGLGKSDKEVKRIYKKIERGEKITAEDVEYLEKKGAMMNSRKLVYTSKDYYIKTSVMALTRGETSYQHPKVTQLEFNKKYNELDRMKEEGASNQEIAKYIKEVIHPMWLPIPGREKAFKLVEKFETRELDWVANESASKGKTPNIGKFENGEWSITPQDFANEHWREQLITDAHKDEIVHGTQSQQLVWSEQDENAIAYFAGKKIDKGIGKLSRLYEMMKARRVHKKFIEFRRTIIDDEGDIVWGKMIRSFQRSAERSGASEYIMELFSSDKFGNPKYNLNIPAIELKAEAMFLNYFSNSALKQKTNGEKFTLASDEMFPVLRVATPEDLKNLLDNGEITEKEYNERIGILKSDFAFLTIKKGRVIRKDEFEKMTNNTRKVIIPKRLQYGLKDDSNIHYAECIVSEPLAKKLNLKPGDEIPPSVAKMIGVRIPTQDKHSMVNLRVVDFVGAEYGNTIFLPAEITFIAGSDFDIDALYGRKLNSLNKNHLFGDYAKAKNTREAISMAKEEYFYSIDNSKEFKEELKANLALINEEDKKKMEENKAYREERIKLAEELTREVLGFYRNKDSVPTSFKDKVKKNWKIVNSKDGNLFDIEPITNEEIDNYLFEMEENLIRNDSNHTITDTPVDTKLLKDAKEHYKENLSAKSSDDTEGIATMLDKLRAWKANDAGKDGIPPAAIKNILFQQLHKNEVELISSSLFGRFNGFAKGAISKDEFGQILGEAYLDYDGKTEKRDRINHALSTVLGAMADNAKDRYAGMFNLTTPVLGTILTMVSMGMPLRFALAVANQPIIKEYAKLVERKRSAIQTKEEQKSSKDSLYYQAFDAIFNADVNEDNPSYISIDALETNHLKSNRKFGHAALESQIVAANEFKKEELSPEIQKYVLDEFLKAEQIGYEIANVSKILSLIKGTKSSFSETEDIHKALNDLGVKVIYEAEKAEDAINPTASVKLIFPDEKAAEKLKTDAYKVLKDPFVEEQLKTFLKMDKDSAGIFIMNTPFMKTLFGSVKNNLKEFEMNNPDNIKNLRYSMLAFIAVNVYKSKYFKITGRERKIELESLFEDKLDKALKAAQVFDQYKNNPLIKYLHTEKVEYKSDKGNFKGKTLYKTTLTVKTEENPALTEALIAGFRELMLDDTTTIPGTDLKGIDLAQMLYGYLAAKDSFMFKRDSFISQISPIVFLTISNGLDQTIEMLNKDKLNIQEFKKLTGMSPGEMKKEFYGLFTRHPDNSQLLNWVKDFGSFNKEINKVKVNPVKQETKEGRKYVSISISDGIKKAKSKKEFSESEIQSIKKNAKSLGSSYTFKVTGEGAETNIQFPKTIIKEGELYELIHLQKGVLRLSLDDLLLIQNYKAGKLEGAPNKIKQAEKILGENDSWHKVNGFFEKDGKQIGYGATYMKVDSLGVSEISNYAYKMKEISDFQKGKSKETEPITQAEEQTTPAIPSQQESVPSKELKFGSADPFVETEAPKTINVYWGGQNTNKPENSPERILSNLAPRKFTWEGRKYGSVEHAYQSNKSGTFDKATYDKYVKAGGYGTKIRGKGTVAEMKAADSLGLMKKLVVESFKQNLNSDAAKVLLQYHKFTHNTNELIDKAFLEGLELAKNELSRPNPNIEVDENGPVGALQTTNRRRKISKDNLDAITRKLTEKTGIQVEYDYQMKSNGRWDWINNKVILNPDRVKEDTPFHEFLHPFVFSISKHNKPLYDSLIKSLKESEEGKAVLKAVNENPSYSKLTEAQREQETLVQLLGEYAANYDAISSQEKPSSVWQTVKDLIQYLLDLFTDGKLSAENLDPNISLREFAEKFVDANEINFKYDNPTEIGTLASFMKSLTKEQRESLRKQLGKNIKIKC